MHKPRISPFQLFGIIAAIDCVLIVTFQLLNIGDPFAFLFEDPRPDALRDTFMDHFNSIWAAYLRGTDGPYNSIYPPLVETIYLLLGNMAIGPEATSAYDLRGGATDTNLAPVSFALVEAVVVVAVAFAVHAIARDKDLPDKTAYVGSMGIVLSLPVIFSIERGNSMLFCVLFLLLFAHFFPRKTRRDRILAIAFFALAVNIKLYPAIFVLMYVHDGRWKEAVWATVASLVLFFVPFAVFNGFDSFLDFLNNLFGTTSSFGGRGFGYALALSNTVNFTLGWLGGDIGLHIPNRFLSLLVLVSIGVFFITAIIRRKSIPYWKGLLFCGCCITLFPNFSYVYNLCFLIPGAVLFFCSTNALSSKREVAVFVLLCLSLLSLPFNIVDIAPTVTDQLAAREGLVYNYRMSLGTYVNSLGVAILWLVFFVDFIRALIKPKKDEATSI